MATTFAGFPTFWPIVFHLLASYSLIAARSAALCKVSIIHLGYKGRTDDSVERLLVCSSTYFVFSKLGVVHILLKAARLG